MKRNHAMAVAATTAMIGVAGVVTAAALTGTSVFGLHFGGRAAPVAVAELPDTTTSEAPTSQPPTTDTLPPAVVVQTEYVDQYVTWTVAPAAPVAYQPAAAPAPAPDPEPEPVYQPPATEATAPPTAATTAATLPPATDPPTTAAPTTAATTAPTAATTTTLFDRTKYPFKVDIPADWGSKPIPALPTPAAGKQWQECELHSWGWACQYP